MPHLPWPSGLRSRSGWTPDRSRALLAGLTSTVWSTVRALTASTLDVPQVEAKLAAGMHVHELVELAAALQERLAELSVPTPAREPVAPDAHRLAHTLRADPATDRVVLLYGYWLPRLDAEIRAGLSSVDRLLDGPSWRLLRRAQTDLADALEWGRQAVDRCGPAGLTAAVVADVAAITGAGQAAPAFDRPRSAARDPRYRTFADTRSYRKAPDWVDGDSEYDCDLVELLRVNRDEIDAIETFALALFDLVDQAPLPALRHLARLSWDEARHAAIGHLVLEERGNDGFDLACSMIGINLRAAMNGYDAWAQITLFGELAIIRPMRELARRATAVGDERIAAVFGFICSDEVLHLRESRDWLERLHPAGGLEAAAEAVRREAARLLSERGVLAEEQYLALTPAEIFALVGE
jgi:hypothetical protein